MSASRITWANPPVGTGRGHSYATGMGGLGWSRSIPVRHRQRILRDNILGITKPSIRRLARRGGIRRMKSEIYDTTRAILKSYLEDVLAEACLLVELGRRKTIKTTDVIYVLKRRGTTLYGFDPSRVQHRSGRH